MSKVSRLCGSSYQGLTVYSEFVSYSGSLPSGKGTKRPPDYRGAQPTPNQPTLLGLRRKETAGKRTKHRDKEGRGGLVVRSRLWGRRAPGSKPDSTEDPPCMGPVAR
ncbi:hypothetical protein AVEN_56405-1 [Araneus ventricosus]|uniref:Uncharacterized protein n=1 Tax=Araneus ventricosus TaxID=182803 RepID=A0A4Y2GLN9_ARAVE|nr:hypothetical protein AVEN_56405-1 [Araneus ventricosus]